MLIHCYRAGAHGLWLESLLALTGLDVLDSRRRAVVRLGTPLTGHDAADLQLASGRLEDLFESLRDPLSSVLLGESAPAGGRYTAHRSLERAEFQ